MAYESSSFKEHHLVRLPTLEKLEDLGWETGQIQAPSPRSKDHEWRVPKNPSSAANREKGRSFDGFPVDIAIFDSPAHKGDPEHVSVIVECKAPDETSGVTELETYLGLEPRAKLGVWTNGTSTVRVYKLPSGDFHVEKNAELPTPGENLLLHESVRFEDLCIPSIASLKAVFNDLLALIASSDGRSTRSDARLNQICNLLLLKLDSDSLGKSLGTRPVAFQIGKTPHDTAQAINIQFRKYKKDRRDLFSDDEKDEILFDDATIHAAVAELQPLDLIDLKPDALAIAFQVFRNANLKVGDGQYFTPGKVIEAATKLMCIEASDKVIDPACGTGGFLSEAYLQVLSKLDRADAVRWANAKLYGVDLDDINVKLTRALMVGVGDGSTHVKLGDSIRSTTWPTYGHGLADALADDSYDVVLTNPPFGQDLKISPRDASSNQLSVCAHGSGGAYATTELGIAFVERAWRLLHAGGRLGIVLPETYFFSSSYSWFRSWLDDRFALKAVLNIPMEAFQGFCRAKTNFYVLVKKGTTNEEYPVDPSPYWMIGNSTWISYAPTIGINKDGSELFVVDQETQTRTTEIDNRALVDVDALLGGEIESQTARFVTTMPVSKSLIGVPQYHDRTSLRQFEGWVPRSLGCSYSSLGDLVDSGLLLYRAGHGSPSLDLRNGDVPYIKVSDLRNGQVNVNSTNMVSRVLAERYWKGPDSGIQTWDVITPARASKNIGEPAVVLPGQENVVLTKEVLVLRPAGNATFDSFFLAWALMLPLVQKQWKRVVFMQTNREDLGSRWREIEVPVPSSPEEGRALSQAVRSYYTQLAILRQDLLADLSQWDL